MMEEKNSKSQESKSRKAGLNRGSSFLVDAYNDFRNTKTNELSNTIEYNKFSLIMKDIYTSMASCILDGKEIAIPCSMGVVLVNKNQNDKRSVADYKSSNEHGRIIKEYNDHTDGYRFSIKWIKGKPIFGIQNGYQFKSSRVVARELASRLKNGYGYKYQSLSKNKVYKNEI